jgi:hypothetical protein
MLRVSGNERQVVSQGNSGNHEVRLGKALTA